MREKQETERERRVSYLNNPDETQGRNKSLTENKDGVIGKHFGDRIKQIELI